MKSSPAGETDQNQPESPPVAGEESQPERTLSFSDEVRALTQGLGWGIRWLGVSLAWGLCFFAFLALLLYALAGGTIPNPGPYYGLIVVMGLLTVILSFLRRRV